MVNPFTDCSSCPQFNTRACRNCAKYRDIQLQSGKRRSVRSVPIDDIPERLLSSLPDSRAKVLPGAIKLLPIKYSIPFLALYLAGHSIAEIATNQGVSRKTISRRLVVAERIIKKNVQ